MATNQLRRKPIGIIIFMYDDDDDDLLSISVMSIRGCTTLYLCTIQLYYLCNLLTSAVAVFPLFVYYQQQQQQQKVVDCIAALL